MGDRRQWRSGAIQFLLTTHSRSILALVMNVWFGQKLPIKPLSLVALLANAMTQDVLGTI